MQDFFAAGINTTFFYIIILINIVILKYIWYY